MSRFPMWDRWKEITQFRIACEAALTSERARWADLPVVDPDKIIISSPVDENDFKCSLSDYKRVLGDKHILFSMLLASYTGLIEEHGRDLISFAITEKGVPRARFPNLSATDPVDEAAEEYIRVTQMEAWGTNFLKLGNMNWSNVTGGMSGVIEAAAIRNLTAHGLKRVNTKAFNRMVAAGCSETLWPIATEIQLDKKKFEDLVRYLRSFARNLVTCAGLLSSNS